MMKYRSAVLVLALFSMASCSEVFEEALEDKKVQLIAPANNAESTQYSQLFWWDAVEGATRYHLQIVTPDFNAPALLITDTVLVKTKHTVSLNPGTYEWRVRAENSSSATGYTSAVFIVKSSDLSQQTVVLSEPSDNFFTSKTAVTFRWQSLFGATRYRLQADTQDVAASPDPLLEMVTSSLNYAWTLSQERSYQWRVRAENDSAISNWSGIFHITYDKTPPDTVVLISPATNAQVTKPVQLKWNAEASAETYKVYAYKSDSTTLYNASFPLTTSSSTYSFIYGVAGEKIYWRVQAIDKAGNAGPLSKRRFFIID